MTSESSLPLAVPGDLGWNLAMVLRGYQRQLETAVDGLPGGVRCYQVLSTVIHRDLPSQQAIGAHLAIDRTVLTYLLDGMVEAKLVERIPDPTDRRARKIRATTEGLSVLARYEQRVADVETGVLSGIAGDDAHRLAALLRTLAASVHRADPTASPCEAVESLTAPVLEQVAGHPDPAQSSAHEALDAARRERARQLQERSGA
ncbi:MarR family winged helix-turn-helix transcriptional regulator [Cryobacterium sp. Y11]|uniref:MarR family winged helix-turn-helix transcriptional regulator n=1 Tax=Cryobacterium sp. Y11 TaxID=2045016 RepID=UPI000CE482E2|nr:MarR family winged helix-turn-helix transcriptional regulator [Cryobacterium sp. Y11]